MKHYRAACVLPDGSRQVLSLIAPTACDAQLAAWDALGELLFCSVRPA